MKTDTHDRLRRLVIATAATAGLMSTLPAHAAPGQVYVNLFEYKWTDVAQECKNFLGPKGFSAVQISVPTEAKSGINQWWARYQPVSYKIASRSGTREELAAMVNTCRDAGVAIYADVVLNHMANLSGTGEAGSVYREALDYPSVPYSAGDFHARCTVNDSSVVNIQQCWLGGDLPDLRTEADGVRQKLAAYLRDLLSLGVAGFRIDAAKHMQAVDLQAILQLAGPPRSDIAAKFGLNKPWVTHEIYGGFGPIAESERGLYFSLGSANEFKYKDALRETFDRRNGLSISRLFDIIPVNGSRPNPWGMFASQNATVFVSNHDTERHDASMNYSYGKMFNLGVIFMLAYPYGQPQLQSGFKLYYPTDAQGRIPDQQPVPSGTIYDTAGNANFAAWDAAHRLREVANMVAFRNSTQDRWQVDDWTTDGASRIAFHRGEKGFIAINRDDYSAWSATFRTGMAAGRYCNVINGELSADKKSCSGDVITVNADSTATLRIGSLADPGMPTVAIHVGQKIADDGATCVNATFNVDDGTTVWGQDVYLTGSLAELGNWNTSLATKMSASAWPRWTTTKPLKGSTTYEFKFIKKGVYPLRWETGANRSVTTPPCSSGNPVALTINGGSFRQ